MKQILPTYAKQSVSGLIWELICWAIRSPFETVHTDELKSIVLLLDDLFVEDDGVDVALLVPLWMGLYDRTFGSSWSGGSLVVGEWIGSNDVRTGLVSPLAWISFSIATKRKIFQTSKIAITPRLTPKGVFLLHYPTQGQWSKITPLISWCVKGTGYTLPRIDSLVPSMNHDKTLACWSLFRSCERNMPHPEILKISNWNAESVQCDWLNNGRNRLVALISDNVKVTPQTPVPYISSFITRQFSNQQTP